MSCPCSSADISRMWCSLESVLIPSFFLLLGHYMYVDSVYVKHFQEVAQLISSKTTAPISGCLSFYYQLKQESSIIFTVYLRDMSGFYEEIWKTDSALNAEWALAEVDFNAPYPMEVK